MIPRVNGTRKKEYLIQVGNLLVSDLVDVAGHVSSRAV